MELQRYIGRSGVIIDMKARDRWTALEEMLSRVLPAAEPVYERVLRSLRQSEQRKCSAVGRSVTIIHAITEEVTGVDIILGISKRGIPWNAPDDRVINILWLMIHPESEQPKYLELLARAMRMCRDDEIRRRLIASSQLKEVTRIITEADCNACLPQ